MSEFVIRASRAPVAHRLAFDAAVEVFLVTRKIVAAPLNILCVLAFADAGCRVYDSSLVTDLPPARTEDAGTGTNSSAAVSDMPEEERVVAACGNGRVDESERCDTAIPRGQPGACPEA